MTTKINIFNEGPGDVLVTESEPVILDDNTTLANSNWNKETILAPAQGLETYIWAQKKVVVEERL